MVEISQSRQIFDVRVEKICDINLAIDPNNLWDLNLLDFCFDQLDAGLFDDTPLGNEFDLDEDAFEVMWIS